MGAALALAAAYPMRASGGPVSGTILSNAVWTAADSPIIVTSNVTVVTNVCLTIAEGVQVQMAESVRITIRGMLQALGTATSPIVFTNSPSSVHGGQLRIEGADYSIMATGLLRHCIFRMPDPNAPAVYGSHCILNLSDSDVRSAGEGVQAWDSRIEMIGNTVEVYTPLDPVDLTRVAGLFATNTVNFPNGDLNAVDVNYTYDGPGDPWITIEGNTVRGGLGSNSDCLDLGTAHAIVRGNHLLRCGDKGISLGEGTVAYVYDNFIEQCGMGLGVKDRSMALCANNTIVDCTYGIKSYQKFAGGGGGITVMTNCIIWACGQSVLLLDGSTLTAANCDIKMDGTNAWPGANNINADPQFADPSSQNYRLLPGSPGINSGTNQPWMDTALDMDGEPRLAEGLVDMGCYELNPGPLNCNFAADPATGPPSLTVSFTARLSGTNTAGVFYRWDFGADGSVDRQDWGLASVTHVYTNAGRYSVSLAVSNAVGETAIAEKPGCIRVTGVPFVYVSPTSIPEHPYTNWATAARDIQTAVDVGIEGTTVLVTNGTYDLSSTVTVREDVVVMSVNGAGRTTVNGGGLTRCFLLSHPDAVVDGFTITGGHADRGGGVYLAGNGTVQNCILRGNHATADGGGALLAQGGRLRNCVVAENAAGGKGGGVSIEKFGSIDNCTITTNAATAGGGVRTFDGGTIINSILYYNNPGGNVVNDGSLYFFSYSYSCVTPAIAGAGNTASAPVFADPAGGNYRLLAGSAGIDGGQNQVWMGAGTDFAGSPRIVNDIVDMGAFEYGTIGCDFSGTPRAGIPPITVAFDAEVSGISTQDLVYGWDFDGDHRTDEAAVGLSGLSYTYTNYGAYTVSLVVSNAAGETLSVAKPGYIVLRPSVLYVSPTGGHAEPYDTWARAATNIETAVAYAADGGTILVTNGVYRPAAEIVLAKGVALRGVGDSAPVIHGGGTHRCLLLQHTNAVVDGMIITGGRASNGGGVYLNGGTVQHCTIVSNAATVNGGGLYVGANGVAQDCAVLQNSAAAAYGGNAGGGGAYLVNGGTIRRCLVSGNVATRNDGAGLYFYQGGLAQNCVIVSNQAADSTGGAYLYTGGTVESCTIAGNRSSQYTGTRCKSGGTIRNSVIWGNYATNAASTNLTLENYGDVPLGTYPYSFCDTFPPHAGANNLAVDPLFAAPEAGDYRLRNGSPCIDTAGLAGTPSTDYAGVPRPFDGNGDGVALPDMGAYEAVLADADSDHDGMADGWELAHGLDPLVNDAGGDWDHDGVANAEEFVAGTSPQNGTDYFHVVIAATAGAVVVGFDTVAVGGEAYTHRTRGYALESAGALTGAWAGVDGWTNLPAAGVPVRCQAATNAPAFYRARVWLAPAD